MLTSIVLQLHALSSGRITGSTGRAIHGFWFHHWQKIDSDIANFLHQQNNPAPFTLSPLMGMPPPKRGQTTIHTNTPAWIRLTTLHADLSQLLLNAWLPSLPDTLEIGHIPWSIDQIALTPEQHPWARQQHYADLFDHNITPTRHWSLQFLTPTTFHSTQNAYLPFPLPNALVSSWIRRWQAFSPFSIQPEWDWQSRIRQELFISAYNLETVPVRYDKRLTIGCVGTLTLHAKALDPKELAMLSLFSDYAFFCGSGHHTTQGMGLTRRIESYN